MCQEEESNVLASLFVQSGHLNHKVTPILGPDMKRLANCKNCWQQRYHCSCHQLQANSREIVMVPIWYITYIWTGLLEALNGWNQEYFGVLLPD